MWNNEAQLNIGLAANKLNKCVTLLYFLCFFFSRQLLLQSTPFF